MPDIEFAYSVLDSLRVVAVLTAPNGKVLNGTTAELMDDTNENFVAAGISMSDVARRGMYRADVTPGAPAGTYQVWGYLKAGDDLLVTDEVIHGPVKLVWDGEAVVDQTPRVTITPLLASISNPRFSTRRLAAICQGTAPTDVVTITDGQDPAQPVDLSGRSVRMVVCELVDANSDDSIFDDELEGLYKYETGSGGNLEIGGDDNNQITITHDATKTTTPGLYPYFIVDVTTPAAPTVILRGFLPVIPAVLDV